MTLTSDRILTLSTLYPTFRKHLNFHGYYDTFIISYHKKVTTHTVLMKTKPKTVRYITAIHYLEYKTIHSKTQNSKLPHKKSTNGAFLYLKIAIKLFF